MLYRSYTRTERPVKYGSIIMFLYLLSVTSMMYSQEVPPFFSFSFASGYGSYAMPDLKRINTVTSQNLPFRADDVNSFDPGPFFSVSVRYQNDVLCAALGYQNYSTGSRIGLKDYSGIYTFDQIAGGHFAYFQPGLIFGNRYVSVMPSVPVGLMFSSLRLEENLKVGDFESHDDLNVVAKSLIIEPSLNVNLSVLPFLSLTCGVGWMFDSGGKYHVKKHKEALLDIDGQVKSGWQGWRLTAGIILRKAYKNPTVREFRESEYFDSVPKKK